MITVEALQIHLNPYTDTSRRRKLHLCEEAWQAALRFFAHSDVCMLLLLMENCCSMQTSLDPVFANGDVSLKETINIFHPGERIEVALEQKRQIRRLLAK